MPKKKSFCHNLPTVLDGLLEKKRLTDAALARHTGLPASSVTKLRLGYTLNPTIETLIPICRFFQIDIEQILGFKKIEGFEGISVQSKIISNQVPVIEMAEITLWIENKLKTNEGSRQYAVTGASLSEKAFALTVKGSMISQLFQEGSVLIFDEINQNSRPQDRGYVVVILEKEIKKGLNQKEIQNLPTIKQIMYDGNDFFLGPFNPLLGGIMTNPKCKILAVMRQSQNNY